VLSHAEIDPEARLQSIGLAALDTSHSDHPNTNEES